MELERKCKKINEYVTVIGKKAYILDGNSPYPAGSRFIINDCKNNNCEHYKICKLCDFDALN